MSIAIISHPDCLLHDTGKLHPESADRVRVIQEALHRYPFTEQVIFYEAPLIDQALCLLVHDQTYINDIREKSPRQHNLFFDEDTVMSPYSLQAIYRAAGAVILAVDLIMQQRERIAFCNIRPPGHHALPNQAMGFCFLNNVAIGVAYAMRNYHLDRIAIIDFDVHHGNGTQAIFQETKQVLYCSSFQHPFYPGYLRENDNEHILSIPLAAGSDSSLFREKVASWFIALHHFKPQLIFFSAGFDAHMRDPLANLQLTNADYVWITRKIAEIAKLYANGRMISVLEGGYDLQVLQECVPLHIAAMLDDMGDSGFEPPTPTV